MTRDQAIKVLRHTLFKDDKIPKELQELNESCAGGWIDAFAALGILKLDEAGPRLEDKLGMMQAFDALRGRGFTLSETTSTLDAINLAGLRIVEK